MGQGRVRGGGVQDKKQQGQALPTHHCSGALGVWAHGC